MDQYRIVMHPIAYREAEAYRSALSCDGIALAGSYLQKVLSDQDVDQMSTEVFIENLMHTKPPQIFAESSLHGDGSDWNQTELTLLGDIGVAVDVTVFDDGKHHHPKVHESPFSACLLFTPGALLRNDQGGAPADWDKVTKGGHIDPAGYQRLYERRLLPLLIYANEHAGSRGKQALVTVPGLGCGQFAGPFIGQLGEQFKDAWVALLEKHGASLPNITAVYYDPFMECQNERIEIHGMSLLVRPLMQGHQDKPQLCRPVDYAEEGDDFSDCLLFSVVAWDHVSWPGNDFYGGARATDDGVKAAATSSMKTLTGIEGQYNPARNQYDPPAPYQTWGEVVKKNRLRMTVANRLVVLP